MDPEAVAAALAGDGAEQRAAAYAAIEAAVRDRGTSFVVACAQPLIVSVLCAPASKVGVAEWQRASLLLAEMVKLDGIAVGAELLRIDNTSGVRRSSSHIAITAATASDNVFEAMMAKEPSQALPITAVQVFVTAAVAAVWAALDGLSLIHI